MLHKDPELLSAYRRGDQKAFETVYLNHFEPLRRFLVGGFTFVSQGRTCRFRGADAGIDIDGVLQESFARAFAKRTRETYDGERPFQNYLFSIAKNLVLREFNQQNRLLHVDQNEEMTDSFLMKAQSPIVARTERAPERQVADDQLLALTTSFVRTLNEEEARFFGIRFAEEQTQQATALAMGVTRARVKVLEKRLRQQFLEMLRQNGYFTDYSPKPRWSRKTATA